MILFYTFFAFLSSFVREMIKDIEDIEGDRKLGCTTFPIVAGIKVAKFSALILIVLLICLIEYAVLGLHFINFENSILSAILLNFLTVIPLIFIGLNLLIASERKDYSRLSKYMKLVMLTGILSIITLKIKFPI